MIARILGGCITILIGSALLPELKNMVKFYDGIDLIQPVLDKEPRRQTYLEYVEERLAVEKMMRRSR